MESYLLKSIARDQLKGKWGLAIVTSVLAMLLLNLISIGDAYVETEPYGLTVFFTIGYLFIASPIQAGKAEFFLNIAKGKEAKVTDLFSQFNIFLKVFGMTLLVYLIEFLVILIPLVLVVAALFLSGFDFVYSGLSINVIIITIFFLVIMTIPAMIVELKYSQVLNIMVENPHIGIRKCMKLSGRMMKGYKWKYFCLQLSFLGWWILSILTLGIAAFWAIPYSSLSSTNFYLELRKKQEKDVVL